MIGEGIGYNTNTYRPPCACGVNHVSANWQTHFYNRIRASIFYVKKPSSYQAFNTLRAFTSRELS